MPPLALAATLLAACLDHALIHPRTAPAGVTTWDEEVDRGKLRLRLEWARPPGDGPFPAVLVHPEAGHQAREMRPILHDLAARGYLAVAADYRREIGGRHRNTLFTWRDRDDARAAFDLVSASPLADVGRIGLLGFSQGGVYSLLIAAETQAAAAVVAYYPVTDFALWLEEPSRRRVRRWVFRVIRWHFRRQSGAGSDEELRTVFARASPLRHAERLHAPVLLVHGDRDTSAGVEESRRLEARLRELGREVELLVVPGAGHVFNFRHRGRAELAWQATVVWLDRHLAERTAGDAP